MLRSPIRRVDIARSWQLAREQFAAVVAERDAMFHRHLAELADLRRELHELRSIFLDVVTTLRAQAEVDVATQRHELEVLLARLERDPTRPLQ